MKRKTSVWNARACVKIRQEATAWRLGVGLPYSRRHCTPLLFTNGVRRERVEKPRDIVNRVYHQEARSWYFVT